MVPQVTTVAEALQFLAQVIAVTALWTGYLTLFSLFVFNHLLSPTITRAVFGGPLVLWKAVAFWAFTVFSLLYWRVLLAAPLLLTLTLVALCVIWRLAEARRRIHNGLSEYRGPAEHGSDQPSVSSTPTPPG